MGGELALGPPIGPNRLLSGVQTVAPATVLHDSVMGLPKLTLAGLVSIRAGELVCSLRFQDAAPCSVSPGATSATTEVSIPRIRKFCPLVPKVKLPVSPGSKKPTCMLSQFSWYTEPFHWKWWFRNSVFQPNS